MPRRTPGDRTSGRCLGRNYGHRCASCSYSRSSPSGRDSAAVHPPSPTELNLERAPSSPSPARKSNGATRRRSVRPKPGGSYAAFAFPPKAVRSSPGTRSFGAHPTATGAAGARTTSCERRSPSCAEFGRAHPNAPRVGVGDLSLPEGGYFGREVSGGIGHATHQNGLDVDVYYPRLDRRERPPRTVAQVDVGLAQELVDMFVAAGAVTIYVGPNLPLTGPAGCDRAARQPRQPPSRSHRCALD